MEKLIYFREYSIAVFKKYEYIILFILKLLIGFFVFNKITDINLYNTLINPYMKSSVLFLISILSAVFVTVMPTPLSFLLISLLVSISISTSLEVAIVVFLFLLLVLIFYVLIAPKESYFIIFTILAFYFKIPYIVPLIAGLYFGITTIIPITIGTFIWRSIPIIQEAISANTSTMTSLSDIISVPQKIFLIHSFILKGVLANRLWVSEALIFALVVFLVFVISKLTFDYAKDIAIVLGGMLNIIGFLIVIILMSLSISVLSVMAGTIVCVALALIIRFYDNILDYDTAERLEFSDEEYYYYVKRIPKLIPETKKNKKLKPVTTIKKDPKPVIKKPDVEKEIKKEKEPVFVKAPEKEPIKETIKETIKEPEKELTSAKDTVKEKQTVEESKPKKDTNAKKEQRQKKNFKRNNPKPKSTKPDKNIIKKDTTPKNVFEKKSIENEKNKLTEEKNVTIKNDTNKKEEVTKDEELLAKIKESINVKSNKEIKDNKKDDEIIIESKVDK